MEIDGNVALVTGGASGLGKATARYMSSRGAKVVIFDRDDTKAKEVANELGAGAVAVAGSILDEVETQAAVDAAATLGDLRMVFAIAGGATAASAGRTVSRNGTPLSLEGFSSTVELNLVGTFNTLRLGAAAMAKLDPANDDGERGVIVNTASIAGYEGQIGQVAYGSAKAGIIGMTLIAARDLASAGIRVNCIAPGTMGTEAWGLAPSEMRETLEAKVPFPRRFGKPEEFAALAEHLVTNRYLNGHVARLDGAIRFDPK
ncbi:MAG: short-chain dehydrogenase/reductase [Actinomycetia bacterium]|nr:short-chain dehydrogenase/reductase [Actinomycetes bacterium]